MELRKYRITDAIEILKWITNEKELNALKTGITSQFTDGAVVEAINKPEKMTTLAKKLAEKLGVTDRSISNWENGVCLPDCSLFKQLYYLLLKLVKYFRLKEIRYGYIYTVTNLLYSRKRCAFISTAYYIVQCGLSYTRNNS